MAPPFGASATWTLSVGHPDRLARGRGAGAEALAQGPLADAGLDRALHDHRAQPLRRRVERTARGGAVRAYAQAAHRRVAAWTARRPAPSAIWWRHEVPSATIQSSAPAARTAGRSDSSPIARETWAVSAW